MSRYVHQNDKYRRCTSHLRWLSVSFWLKGDSGSPLFRWIIDEDGWEEIPEIVGLSSWGYGCAQSDVPGVYTSTGHYYDWIVNVTGMDFEALYSSITPSPSSLYSTITPSPNQDNSHSRVSVYGAWMMVTMSTITFWFCSVCKYCFSLELVRIIFICLFSLFVCSFWLSAYLRMEYMNLRVYEHAVCLCEIVCFSVLCPLPLCVRFMFNCIFFHRNVPFRVECSQHSLPRSIIFPVVQIPICRTIFWIGNRFPARLVLFWSHLVAYIQKMLEIHPKDLSCSCFLVSLNLLSNSSTMQANETKQEIITLMSKFGEFPSKFLWTIW